VTPLRRVLPCPLSRTQLRAFLPFLRSSLLFCSASATTLGNTPSPKQKIQNESSRSEVRFALAQESAKT